MDPSIDSGGPSQSEASAAQSEASAPSTATFEAIRIEAFEMTEMGDSHYRISVNNHVKLVSIKPNVISSGLISFSSKPDAAILPPLPPGDWTHGTIDKCPHTGKPVWTTTLDEWPGCTNLWHGRTFKQSDLRVVVPLRPHIQIVAHPQWPHHHLVYKFATFPHKIPLIDHESSIYKLLEESFNPETSRFNGFEAPRFGGHVEHEGKVRGFLLEHLFGRHPNLAGGDDASESCGGALQRLHELGRIGITHEQIKMDHFILTRCETGNFAALIDYSQAKPVEFGWELGEEMRKFRILFGIDKPKDHEPASSIDQPVDGFDTGREPTKHQ